MNPSTPSRERGLSTGDSSNGSAAILRLLDRPLSEEDLRQGTEQASKPAADAKSGAIRLLLFRIGNERAALPAKILRRVTPALRVRSIPHRSRGVLRGVCNIQGELVLSSDLHRLLGLPARAEQASESSRMVVIGPPDNSWAFEVDEVVGIENVDAAAVREPPVTVAHALHDFTHGVTDIAEHSVTILDGDRVLAGFKAGLA